MKRPLNEAFALSAPISTPHRFSDALESRGGNLDITTLRTMLQKRGQSAPAPAWPRQSAWHECPHRGHGGQTFRPSGCPSRSIDWRGTRIELVGLMAMDTRRSCPVDMPQNPPEWFDAKPSGSVHHRARCRAGSRSQNQRQSPPLDRINAHHGVGNVGIKLVEQGLPQPTGSPLASTIRRAPQESPALRNSSI